MEADWAAEVGSELPSIVVPWEGFLDLRHNRSAVKDLDEAAAHPALSDALLILNSENSFVFTTKCDVWKLTGSEIAPDEFGARYAEALEGFASYIDILQRDHARFNSFDFHERWARALTTQLRSVGCSNGRVELVIRSASVDAFSGYGVTLYAAGCGADSTAAYASWRAVLRAAVTATINLESPPPVAGE